MSNLLSSLFNKVSDLLMIWVDCSLKTSNLLKKFIFFICFWQFFPLFMPKKELLPLLFAHSLFFKEQLERFAPVTLKERPWVICSGAHDKRAMGAIHSFSWASRSFAHRKRVNCSKQVFLFCADHVRLLINAQLGWIHKKVAKKSNDTATLRGYKIS